MIKLFICLPVHLFMQKVCRAFIQKYGSVPLIFVLIYCSISNLLLKLFNTDFSGALQPHFQLSCPFVKCKFMYNFNMCPDCYFRTYKVEQVSSLLATRGAKWQRSQVRAIKQSGINILRTKNEKHNFILECISWGFDCIGLKGHMHTV